jgi:hypothetical protein
MQVFIKAFLNTTDDKSATGAIQDSKYMTTNPIRKIFSAYN